MTSTPGTPPTVPVVSVVTPVYNGQRFISECIESVLAQTLREFEYVLLDNCSTDETSAICARYSAADPRIRVVRATEFLGIYGNHNRALREMHPGAAWCKIVHADDWLAPECLERMVRVGERHPRVGVVGAFRMVGARVEGDWVFPPDQEAITGRELLRTIILGPSEVKCITGSPTTLLLRARLIREKPQFYDETFWSADTEAAYRTLLGSDFGFVPQILTFTRAHPARLTTFSHRVNTYIAQEGRLLLRYGPKVLAESEYRLELRRWARRYLRFLLRARVRRSERRDELLRDFHRREIEYMRRDVAGDRGVQRTLWVLERLVKAPRTTPGDGARDLAAGPSSPDAVSRYTVTGPS